MIRCPDHDYHLKPDGCPMCRALKAEAELESLRQENSRLREALDHIAFWLENGDVHWPTAAKVATAALHSPINIDTLDP